MVIRKHKLNLLWAFAFVLLASCTDEEKVVDEAVSGQPVDVPAAPPESTSGTEVPAVFQPEVVYFPFDSDVLSPMEQRKLQDLANHLMETNYQKLVIEGHCDERGSAQYNIALGHRRAESVKRYLETLGVSSGTLETQSFGYERPAVHGHSPDTWKLNRRSEFIISK